MSNITPYRISELLQIVFELLWDHPEGMVAGDILSQIPQKTRLTEYEIGTFPSIPNIPRYEIAIRLAIIPLVKAGWFVKNNKGQWNITDEGHRACKQFTGAGEFYREVTRISQYYFVRMRGRPTIFLALEDAREKSWKQIREFLLGIRPFEFKLLISDLLSAMGYHVYWQFSSEYYHGKIDCIAYTDPLGAKQPRIMVQIKHKGQPITVEGIKDFLSVLDPGDFGLLVSSGGFTHGAREEAGKHRDHKIALLDLDKFYELWIEYYQSLAPEGRTRLPLEPVYFLSPFE